jgi:hypothetical protein
MLFFNPNLNLNFAQQVCQESLNQNSTKSRTCRPNHTPKKPTRRVNTSRNVCAEQVVTDII